MTAPAPTSYLSNWWGNALLAQLVVTGGWLALHAGDPTPAGIASTELVAGGYGRVKLNFAMAGSKTTANTNATFIGAVPQVDVTHLAIWTDQVGGHVYFVIELGTPLTPVDVSALPVGVGDIALTL